MRELLSSGDEGVIVMNHVSFDQICQIADGNTSGIDAASIIHVKSCSLCQKEIVLQQSLIKVSKKMDLIQPSERFTQEILNYLQPSKKRHWYERILQNLGNVIAMSSVLAFLLYVFSTVGSVGIQIEKPTDSKIVTEISNIIQNGTAQLIQLFKVNTPQNRDHQSQAHIIVFIILSLGILWFFDKILQFFRKQL
jgi:hypothetical protein